MRSESMDIRKAEKLFEMLEETGMAEVELHEGTNSIKISGRKLLISDIPMVEEVNLVGEKDESIIDGEIITSPMVGTFYGRIAPTMDCLVSVGDEVVVGDVVCIIEAMNVKNPIMTDKSGTIKKILCEDGLAVEYDQPLFILD
jgi:acetyl-CoA carboxylase biotin carboxyl carrier protein